MSDARDDAIEAGWQAWLKASDIRGGVEAAVEAAEPVIRADEREAVLSRQRRSMWAEELAATIEIESRAHIYADLRTKVQALLEERDAEYVVSHDTFDVGAAVALREVLALLDKETGDE
jgi:hypothetical protein